MIRIVLVCFFQFGSILLSAQNICIESPDTTVLQKAKPSYHIKTSRNKEDGFAYPRTFATVYYQLNPFIGCITHDEFSFTDSSTHTISFTAKKPITGHYFTIGKHHITSNTGLKLWSYLNPQLYKVHVSVHNDSIATTLHIKDTIGIRDSRFDKSQLWVNNRAIPLKCLEIRSEDNQQDIFNQLHWIKRLHINTLVMDEFPSHTFFNRCDSLGLQVIIKLNEQLINDDNKLSALQNKFLNTTSLIAFWNIQTNSKTIKDEGRPVMSTMPTNTFYPMVRPKELKDSTQQKIIQRQFQPFHLKSFLFKTEVSESVEVVIWNKENIDMNTFHVFVSVIDPFGNMVWKGEPQLNTAIKQELQFSIQGLSHSLKYCSINVEFVLEKPMPGYQVGELYSFLHFMNPQDL